MLASELRRDIARILTRLSSQMIVERVIELPCKSAWSEDRV